MEARRDSTLPLNFSNPCLPWRPFKTIILYITYLTRCRGRCFVRYLQSILMSLALVLFIAGCGGSGDSCVIDDDCDVGMICVDGSCQDNDECETNEDCPFEEETCVFGSCINIIN